MGYDLQLDIVVAPLLACLNTVSAMAGGKGGQGVAGDESTLGV